MHFGRNLCEKRQIWVSELRSGEVRSDARPWLMARWKVDVDFLLALMELFSLSITVLELWGETCTARLFLTGVDLFAVKFYLDRVVPHQPLLSSAVLS